MRIASVARLALTFQLPAIRVSSRYFCSPHDLFSESSMPMKLPKAPSNPLTSFGLTLQSSLSSYLSAVDGELVKEDETKEVFYSKMRSFHAAHDDLAHAVKSGRVAEVPALVDAQEVRVNQLLELVGNDPCARESKLWSVLEKSRSILLLQRFFSEGRLASQASLQPCNDNEYISAALTFAQLLNEYVLGRACEGDVESIELCLGVVTELNAKMLEFDFRNGPLRRKYDGLKYAVRNIEDILFELSLQQGSPLGTGGSAANTEEEVASPTKRIRISDGAEESNPEATNNTADATKADMSASEEESGAFQYLDAAEIDAIRTRMDALDQHRELVIKDSRDVQKLAKQAVYAVIRGQLKEARKKLDMAAQCADKILLTVNQYPTLRQGSFSNSLEEWAEGAITLAWVENKRIPSPQELRLVNANEYVGALADFTGEIGRLAVMHAAKRDFAAVKEIQQAELVVSAAITRLSGNHFAKKLEMVNQNTKKVGDVVYELTMLQRSGRQTRTKPADLGMPSSTAEGKGGDDGGEA